MDYEEYPENSIEEGGDEPDDNFQDLEYEGENNWQERYSFKRNFIPSVQVEFEEKMIQQWSRPGLTHVDNSIPFQMMSTSLSMETDTWTTSKKPDCLLPIFLLFGVTKEGNSVLVRTEGFLPYIYVRVWDGFQEEQDLKRFHVSLNVALRNKGRPRLFSKLRARHEQIEDKNETLVAKVEVVRRESLMELFDEASYLKITLTGQSLVYVAKEVLLTGFPLFSQHGKMERQLKFPRIFESNIDPCLRFMAVKRIFACGWISIAAKRYTIVPKNQQVSRCQLELLVHFDDLVGHPVEDEWVSIPPLRTLSFDIECAAQKAGEFPTPTLDPVIQIACLVQVLTPSRPKDITRVVFTLKSCADIPGAIVFSYDTEEELLTAFQQFVNITDPDTIIGYNINNFDYPFLVGRAKHLKVFKFTDQTRLINSRLFCQESESSSKQTGKNANTWIRSPGRNTMDILNMMRSHYKLSSYTLNAVSALFLSMLKDDVHHSQITTLQNGDEQTRMRLAKYCLRDAELPILLMNKLCFLSNNISMSRVTSVPLNWIWERGQQIRTINAISRFLEQDSYFIIPDLKPLRVFNKDSKDNMDDEKKQFTQKNNKKKTKKRKSKQTSLDGLDSDSDDDDDDNNNYDSNSSSTNDKGYEGATVLEPEIGFYDVPIATLDFASLYPSIMIANNMCYTTHVPKHRVEEMKAKFGEDKVKLLPNGEHFLCASVRKGILPQILIALLGERKRVRESAAKEGLDEMTKMVLNGHQLALKVVANSIYGFTGARIGQLPLLEIGSSVTAVGRQMIEFTKKQVELMYEGSKVIYGDTDSVMVRFANVKDVPTAMKLGLEAAARISEKFPSPIKLEFEKVFHFFLLMNKKRYAGLMWERPDKPNEKLNAKGIEIVRRDTCPFQTNLLTTVLNFILREGKVQEAMEHVKKEIVRLLEGNVDLSELIFTQQLSKGSLLSDYKTKSAHVFVADKMRTRNPNNPPKSGDRIPYVFVNTGKEHAYDSAEDPMYVLEKGLHIDTSYYIENKFTKMIKRIFYPIVKERWRTLIFGDHTRIVKQVVDGDGEEGSIKKFTIAQDKCLGCKVVLRGEFQGPPICRHCQPRTPLIFIQHMKRKQELEKRHAQYWSQCQRCQGSVMQDLICGNNDCSIFYARVFASRKLSAMDKIMRKF